MNFISCENVCRNVGFFITAQFLFSNITTKLIL